jgi:hypothetical protein
MDVFLCKPMQRDALGVVRAMAAAHAAARRGAAASG